MSTDTLEDEGFSPKEYMGEDTYIAVGESTNRLEKFEKYRKFDLIRFAFDLETDEELFDGKGRRNRG